MTILKTLRNNLKSIKDNPNLNLKNQVYVLTQIPIRFIILILLSLNCLSLSAQVDTTFLHAHYEYRKELQDSFEIKPWHIVLLGNSITERGPWSEMFPGLPLINRGIGGDNLWGVENRILPILRGKPAVILVMIGVNDISRGIPLSLMEDKYDRIIKRIKRESPGTKIILQTIIPINEDYATADYLKDKNQQIILFNQRIRDLGRTHQLIVIPVFEEFADKSNVLPEKYTFDGIHLNSLGYKKWQQILIKSGLLDGFLNREGIVN